MYGKEQSQFAQFFEDVEEMVHTPSRTSNRVVATPKTRKSTADLETTAMTPRMEIMLRKEKKAKEDEANFTFRPHVNKHGQASPNNGKISGKDSANRFDALYSDALKRHLEAKWKESSDEKDLTFQPKITERGRSRASSRNASRTGSRASSPGPATGTNETAADRLHNTQRGKLKHGTDPDNKLTFKPEITKRAMSIDRKETAKRLYTPNSIEKQREKMAMREMEIKERELENCTFSPKLVQNPKFAAKEKLDIRERMSRFEELKKERLLERQRKALEDELADTTFKPTLISKTKRAATPTKPFHERLAQPFERQPNSEVEAEINASMTFKPTLITKRSASPNGRASEYQSVHERLYKEGEQRKKETQLAMEALKLEAETNFTFNPEINHNSKAVSADAGPVFERLATSTSKQYMQEVLMKVKTELELKDCTFQPKLSTEHYKFVPKEGVDPNTPVHERLNQEAELKRQEKERFEQLRLENALKNHTFTPQINETSKSLVTQRSFIGSPEGGGIGGGSVSGDDIFSRLNAQSTIAKSPRPLNNSVVVSSPSPTRTRSMVISEEERDKLYERLSAAPKTLPPPGTPGAGGEDDRSSVNNRKTAAQIDDVVSRLHATHTKAMKAPVFEDPVPLQSMLRTRSMSNVSTPSQSPDKSLSRRNSISSMDIPGAPGGMSPPKRMMSMSLTMSPPASLVRAGSVKTMVPPAVSPAAQMSNKQQPPAAVSPAPKALTANSRSASMSQHSSSMSSGGAPKVVPRKASFSPAISTSQAPIEQTSAPVHAAASIPAPANVAVQEDVVPKPIVASLPEPSSEDLPVAPKPAPKKEVAPTYVPPPAPPAPVSRSSPSVGGGDFLSKIEASMNMLSMNPAQIVAQHAAANKAPAQQIAAPVPVSAPVVAPVPAPAPVQAEVPPVLVNADKEPQPPVSAPAVAATETEAVEEEDDGSEDEEEEVEEVVVGDE